MRRKIVDHDKSFGRVRGFALAKTEKRRNNKRASPVFSFFNKNHIIFSKRKSLNFMVGILIIRSPCSAKEDRSRIASRFEPENSEAGGFVFPGAAENDNGILHSVLPEDFVGNAFFPYLAGAMSSMTQ